MIKKIKYWLNKYKHQPYDYSRRLGYDIKILIGLVFCYVFFMIIYSNLKKLNEIYLWVFPLGGTLLIIIGVLFIAYILGLIGELVNWLKRQRRWIRYTLIIILFFLIFQIYQDKETIFNPITNIYNNSSIMNIFPLNITNGNAQNNTKTFKEVFSNYHEINTFELEKEIHYLVNQERINNGLKALSYDEKLSDIARDHSVDMTTNNFFSHDNLRGQGPTDRASAKGYRCHKNYGNYYIEGIAENIYQNNLYNSITYINSIPIHDWNNQSEIAESTVQGWMSSSGHRQNILTPTYDSEGIGIAISSDDKVYITQDFC